MTSSSARQGSVVVLDRDGVINAERPDFIRRPEDWEPLPGSLHAMAKLHRAGFRLVVATNQSGVGRGLFTEATLQRIHERMTAELEAAGGELAGIFYCPHHPDDGCRCRKPLPGLLEAVATRFGALDGLPVIGDSARDLEAAKAVSARPILVRTGNGRRTEGEWSGPLEVYDDLAAVAQALIEESA